MPGERVGTGSPDQPVEIGSPGACAAPGVSTSSTGGVSTGGGRASTGGGRSSSGSTGGGSDSAVQDDLFAADEFAAGGPEPTEEERVIALERSLLTDAVRSDPAEVAALLHPDFREVGASGRLWTRPELLAHIAPLGQPLELEVVRVTRVAPEAILLLWRSFGASGSALRSSLWVRDHGDWTQLFHQGTHEL
ncbi:MAG: nuclear transport factor 2 family protein [Micropruina sp.]